MDTETRSHFNSKFIFDRIKYESQTTAPLNIRLYDCRTCIELSRSVKVCRLFLYQKMRAKSGFCKVNLSASQRIFLGHQRHQVQTKYFWRIYKFFISNCKQRKGNVRLLQMANYDRDRRTTEITNNRFRNYGRRFSVRKIILWANERKFWTI